MSASELLPSCPRCCSAPLRLVMNGTGGVYTCAACSYSTARDALVAELLRELRDLGELFGDFARLAIPRLTRCATGDCKGSSDPALEGLRHLAEILMAKETPRC